MAQFWMMFKDCGWPAYLVLMATLLAIPLALVAAILGILRLPIARVLALVALAVSLGVAALGAMGTMLGRSRTEAALREEGIDPELKARILEEGYTEAGYCTEIGAGAAAFPALVSAVGLVLALVWRKQRER